MLFYTFAASNGSTTKTYSFLHFDTTNWNYFEIKFSESFLTAINQPLNLLLEDPLGTWLLLIAQLKNPKNITFNKRQKGFHNIIVIIRRVFHYMLPKKQNDF